jgi:hypothetical protein
VARFKLGVSLGRSLLDSNGIGDPTAAAARSVRLAHLKAQAASCTEASDKQVYLLLLLRGGTLPPPFGSLPIVRRRPGPRPRLSDPPARARVAFKRT